MKTKRTIYNNKEKYTTREKMANPYSNKSIKSRLVKSGAIDLKDNSKWIDQVNGYSCVEPIDPNKKLIK